MSLSDVIARQEAIADGDTVQVQIPKFKVYTICNLRGGIGKTTLAFNLSYFADNLLAIDTCPQGNLSYFYDEQYYAYPSPSVLDLILPHLMPSGFGSAVGVANRIGATNEFFAQKKNYFIRSSDELYLLPSQLTTAISQTSSLQEEKRKQMQNGILFSLKSEIQREMQETSLDKCLIDTSPFFAGATQLSWYAADAMIIPVRTDQQSINSLKLLLHTLRASSSEFRKYLPPDSNYVPKIQMVVLTHCGWGRQRGDRNVPNRPTELYAKQVYDLLDSNNKLLSTDNPDDHFMLLDDFLGSGRISSARRKPIDLLKVGESTTIERVRVAVNNSVQKCKNQLRFIHSLLW